MKKSILEKRAIEIQESSLIEAVVEEDLEKVARFLEAGVSPNAANSEGFTALHFSALSGNASIAALLIGKGASVIATDNKGVSPITIAQQRGHREVADLLLRCFFTRGNGRS